jgi:glycerol-3-phosphate O-acyltransferase
METLNSAFQDIIKQVATSQAETVITEDNVYQEAVKERLPFIDKMLDSLVLPGSGVKGMERLRDLLDKAKSGM